MARIRCPSMETPCNLIAQASRSVVVYNNVNINLHIDWQVAFRLAEVATSHHVTKPHCIFTCIKPGIRAPKDRREPSTSR